MTEIYIQGALSGFAIGMVSWFFAWGITIGIRLLKLIP